MPVPAADIQNHDEVAERCEEELELHVCESRAFLWLK